ncbi:uncharacterized protein LOC126669700 isoform X2 [Mercurialis annua]|uniref:uncharacterized protein LOC126669700 isoform X2 n=1 Tax=Mercurialis annua TaxID=3986 RepID=UPI002160932D|nr:uncharacterized protein LOC126669700 isoform X2 [Mercurialis annua]
MYSCASATETLRWINAIIEFIKPYNSIINAHVVNFFTHKLWESVDQRWIHCLRHEPLQHLLLIPSAVSQEHWPHSLREFVADLRSLAFPRDQVDLEKVFPGLNFTSLNTVLSQGMNVKKKHEVEVLSAVVSFITNSVGAQTIVDVGAGQGYLAQVLSFQYDHSVVAIDASSHHGRVTEMRAERIKKHYAAQMRKYETFLECKEIKAIVSIGCCYNLLSEECSDAVYSHCGFPMSLGVKSAGISLGKNLRDLACQSADRWRSLDEDAGLQNLELHAFRAAFQMVLQKYYPDVLKESPSIGRQGKTMRRQRQRRAMHSALHHGQNKLSTSPQSSNMEQICFSPQPAVSKSDNISASVLGIDASLHKGIIRCKKDESDEKYLQFEKFSTSGLSRLGLKPLQEIHLHEIWKEVEPFAELIGCFWSLRAAFGPILETLILLDRLLFLQEQGSSIEAKMFPIFNPILSPRNLAIIAKRK